MGEKLKTSQVLKQAEEWLDTEGMLLPGFCGAYLSGSAVYAQPQSDWPSASDIDIVAVLDIQESTFPDKPGKLIRNGVLLEITLLPRSEFSSLEHILKTHYLAYALNGGRILRDSCGWLKALAEETAREYAKEVWVRRRCELLFGRIQNGIRNFDGTAPFEQCVNSWVFPTGLTTFLPLAAALANCTVRKRYTACRGVLEQYGFAGFQEELLELLGCQGMRAEELSPHLRELAVSYDLACGTCKTGSASAKYPFRSDISPQSRPVSIGGSQELLDSAYPEEAVFWMAVTFARCQTILEMDAPKLAKERLPYFKEFIRLLGINGGSDFEERNRRLQEFLPRLRRVTEEIICRLQR